MKVTTIPPWHSFTDALAQSLLKEETQQLADTLILLPNRRACRALRDSLAYHSGEQALIMPKMLPFADLDPEDVYLSPQWINADISPPISMLERHGILMQLILKYNQSLDNKGYGQASHASQLAGDLARLIDQIHWEGLDFQNLQNLVPEDYAQHWQITLDFLKIVTDFWPAILKSRGVSDPAAWRRDLILAYAEKWQKNPPVNPVIAAGSTGSIPCTATLIKAVYHLPQGKVILPGLDKHLSEEEWGLLEITHPQYGMARLLELLEIKREYVQEEIINHESTPLSSTARAEIISRAMQPAVSDNWSIPESTAKNALLDLNLIECKTNSDEAGIIALLLREAIEQPDQTASLVTPDRALVQRVLAELQRWQLVPDDTAGYRLSETPMATFMLLLAEVLVASNDILSMLNLFNHPLSNLGAPKGEFESIVETLDKTYCREHRNVSDIIKHLSSNDKLKEIFDLYLWAIEPFQNLHTQEACSLSDLMKAHSHAAKIIAGEQSWTTDETESFVRFWNELQIAQTDFPDISATDYPAFIKQLMYRETVRQPLGYHPRLFILGPLEARSFKTDLMILGGLNEGSWPPLTDVDPWLNRPMRADYGLPLPERRIGLSAHDFAQAFCAKRVVCTRSLRINGTPTLPSRWLLRLETVLQASGQSINKSPSPWLQWYQKLDQPDRIQACQRPAPCPPVYARPRKLSVTQIERWMRDPYALYAGKILKLMPLPELALPISIAEKGRLIHHILEVFVNSGSTELSSLIAFGNQIFKPYEEQPEVMSFWWPRFQRTAAWFIETETTRSPEIAKNYVEIAGSLTIDTKAGPFTITAIADRIDIMHDGQAEIIDYKTGSLPTREEVEQGYASQLSLESAMVKLGGFSEIGPRNVRSTNYWRLRGVDPAGEIRSYHLADKLADEALAGLKNLVEIYHNPTVTYLAQPRIKFALRYNPYAHLTRTQEWMKGNAA